MHLSRFRPGLTAATLALALLPGTALAAPVTAPSWPQPNLRWLGQSPGQPSGRLAWAHSGTAAAPVASATHLLTVHATDLSGQPDNGGTVLVADAGDTSRLYQAKLSHGLATFHVPTGHFWVLGGFSSGSTLRLDLPSEVTVTGDQSVTLAAAQADSPLRFATEHPATLNYANFELYFQSGAPSARCCTAHIDLQLPPGQHLDVSPMAVRPAVGHLYQFVTADLASPASAAGPPYGYALAYAAKDQITSQHYLAGPADLATEDASFYASHPSSGLFYVNPVPAIRGYDGSWQYPWLVDSPQRMIMYYSASPDVSWAAEWDLRSNPDFAGGQASAGQVFQPGQRMAVDWGSYPLHPALVAEPSNVRLQSYPPVPSVTRAGDQLGMIMTAFGDNTPGHTGYALNSPYQATGHWQLTQNGTRLAGGPLAASSLLRKRVQLSPDAATIQLTLDAALPPHFSPLSATSQTTWTWRSSHESGHTLPAGWQCYRTQQRTCAAEPLLSLGYTVAGEALDGRTAPGQQVIHLAVSHQQLSQAAKIKDAALSVSFDGGAHWKPAQLTGSGGSWTAVFTAPAGAQVTLRATASDTAGGSITQTVSRAYQVAAAGH